MIRTIMLLCNRGIYDRAWSTGLYFLSLALCGWVSVNQSARVCVSVCVSQSACVCVSECVCVSDCVCVRVRVRVCVTESPSFHACALLCAQRLLLCSRVCVFVPFACLRARMRSRDRSTTRH